MSDEPLFSLSVDEMEDIINSPAVEVPDSALVSFEAFEQWLMEIEID